MRRGTKRLRVRYQSDDGKRQGALYDLPITVGTELSASIKVRGRHTPQMMTLFNRAASSRRYTLYFAQDFDGWVGTPRPGGRGQTRCALADLVAGGYLRKVDGVFWFTFQSYDHAGCIVVGDMEIRFDFVDGAGELRLPRHHRVKHK